MKRAVAFADGGIRSASKGLNYHGCSAVIEVENEMPREYTRYLGPGGTSNVAEVQGLILILRQAAEIGVTHLSIRLDSRLTVEHALGNWKIKDDRLRAFQDQARELALRYFEHVDIKWVPRKQNARADLICAKMLDKATGRFRLERKGAQTLSC